MTMDLAELRINRTPVSQNSKCEGCVHYDGNAAAKAGACEVGQSPAMCGTGAEPKYGYAALADLAPDEVDDLATPLLTGSSGAMNEHGSIEQTIKMKRVVLGDEDLTIAQRIHGELQGIAKKSIGYAQGEVNAYAGAELAMQRYKNGPEYPMVTVAKSVHAMYLSPRKQHKYGVSDVLMFLQSRGMPVTDEELEICKSRFGPTRQVPVGNKDNPTLPQAAASLHAHNAKNGPVGGRGTQEPASSKGPPNVAPLKAPRNRTPTQPMQFAKSETPNVRKLESADPFANRR